MANLKEFLAQTLGAPVTVITTAETDILNSGRIPVALQSNTVLVDAVIEATVGTAGTTLTIKIYRGGDKTGTLVYTSQAFSVAAGNKVNFGVKFSETLQSAGEAQYAITVTVASATGNTTVNAAGIDVTLF